MIKEPVFRQENQKTGFIVLTLLCSPLLLRSSQFVLLFLQFTMVWYFCRPLLTARADLQRVAVIRHNEIQI